MKTLYSILLVAFSSTAFGQVVIGGDTGSAANKTSVLLDFVTGQNKGIILPYVRTLPSGSNVTEGTILLDATDPTKARVRYYNGVTTGGANGWVDLSSGYAADISTAMAIQPTATMVTEDTSSKTIIGAQSSAADGVLVLESKSKAMILPIVASTADVVSPAPGMMVYVKKASGNRLAVFNGVGWTYWKS